MFVAVHKSGSSLLPVSILVFTSTQAKPGMTDNYLELYKLW